MSGLITPECARGGGLTEAWRIAWMAYGHNIQWVPHGYLTIPDRPGLGIELNREALKRFGD